MKIVYRDKITLSTSAKFAGYLNLRLNLSNTILIMTTPYTSIRTGFHFTFSKRMNFSNDLPVSPSRLPHLLRIEDKFIWCRLSEENRLGFTHVSVDWKRGTPFDKFLRLFISFPHLDHTSMSRSSARFQNPFTYSCRILGASFLIYNAQCPTRARGVVVKRDFITWPPNYNFEIIKKKRAFDARQTSWRFSSELYLTIRRQARGLYRLIVTGEGRSPYQLSTIMEFF